MLLPSLWVQRDKRQHIDWSFKSVQPVTAPKAVEAVPGITASSIPLKSFTKGIQPALVDVFEAPIDMLSFITLHPENWQEHSYVALCGVSDHALLWMLEQPPPG